MSKTDHYGMMGCQTRFGRDIFWCVRSKQNSNKKKWDKFNFKKFSGKGTPCFPQNTRCLLFKTDTIYVSNSLTDH